MKQDLFLCNLKKLIVKKDSQKNFKIKFTLVDYEKNFQFIEACW